jgi:hypothetical protein
VRHNKKRIGNAMTAATTASADAIAAERKHFVGCRQIYTFVVVCCLGTVHDVCMVIHMIPDPDMDSNIVECPYCDKPMQPHTVQQPQPVHQP